MVSQATYNCERVFFMGNKCQVCLCRLQAEMHLSVTEYVPYYVLRIIKNQKGKVNACVGSQRYSWVFILSRSHLPDSAASVKHEEVLKFETCSGECLDFIAVFQNMAYILFHKMVQLLCHCNFPSPAQREATSNSCFKEIQPSANSSDPWREWRNDLCTVWV